MMTSMRDIRSEYSILSGVIYGGGNKVGVSGLRMKVFIRNLKHLLWIWGSSDDGCQRG